VRDEQVVDGSPASYFNAVKQMEITVWCCPTPGCPDYYGATGGERLDEQFSGARVENRAEMRDKTGSGFTKSRADCGSCLQRTGQRVPRVPVRLEVRVPPQQPQQQQPLPLF